MLLFMKEDILKIKNHLVEIYKFGSSCHKLFYLNHSLKFLSIFPCFEWDLENYNRSSFIQGYPLPNKLNLLF